ncbi:MarR family transcriptional regulator [Paenibacillus sp. TRM 82003]|uniref:MarR family winged helix-turn-helix transcriptional regulator n=1 Tax=Kineococcus sp. TRM81007 TaxID=2925831 RepID=UPI001F580B7D|nr:MarR family transcriptional regulator [Kineococcus sp. TRM81007]MCI2239957.1 MarR family transcriptional regulator [Kineococcus sp. TRM81007]MCI3925738.1 MarR family transcriptional regulator [Paenibacillus sp. TRM 82003]
MTGATPTPFPAGAAHGDAAPDDPTGDLAVELRIALLRTARRLRSQKSVDDLTDAQFSVLAHLHVHGPRTPGELAEAEHVRPPSMTRTVAALEGAGWVQRTGHPDDGRQVLVLLTAAGAAAVEETRARRSAWLRERLARLDDDERATLAAAARLLRAVVQE